MGFVHLKNVLKCLNVLKVKLLTMVLYFYKKRVLQRIRLMSSETTLRERYVFFWHSTTSSCGVMIDDHSNKKFSINKICKDDN